MLDVKLIIRSAWEILAFMLALTLLSKGLTIPALRCSAGLMQAILNIISNPVNSTVPIAAEVLKQKGVYDPKRLFGVTTLDVVSHPTYIWEFSIGYM